MRAHAILVGASVVALCVGCNGAPNPNGTPKTTGASTARVTSTSTAPTGSSSTTAPTGSSTTTTTGPTGPSSNAHASAVDIGNLSGAEQELVELVNRARRDPLAEGNRYGLNLSGIPATPPLAPSALLAKAALDHNDDMAKNHYFAHVSPSGVDPAAQIAAAGYVALGSGQNISVDGVGPIDPKAHHRRFVIDAGVNPPVHRYNILSVDPSGNGAASWREFGSSYVSNQVGLVGADWDQYVTENFGRAKTDKPFVTGVAFDDSNNSGEYDAGEGSATVSVTLRAADGTSVVTKTRAAGGFAFQVNDPGTYTVEFQGGPFVSPTSVSIKVGADNVKVDAVVGKGAVAR